MRSIDGRAYLHWIRNIRPGLISRTTIIRMLDETEWKSVSELSKSLDVTSETIRYHLLNMLKENLVEREPDGHGLSDIDQPSLTDFIEQKSRKSKG